MIATQPGSKGQPIGGMEDVGLSSQNIFDERFHN